MDIKHKYDLERLEWQQFEILSFKCLQLDVSKSLTFIEGGSDKGRDFVFNGKTNFFGNGNEEYKYLFQAKHKSKQNSFSSLNNDLKIELEKVFILNKLDYNHYCLVTNISISGTQFDALNETFNSFITENCLSNKIQFSIYSYRHVESCLDNHDFLKWTFPSIIRNTDFKSLIQEIIQKEELNISSGWLSVFEKNKVNFVYTNIFEEALSKLTQNNILLFSGPSKSGKTFNAEMLLLNYFCDKSFVPYKIDKIEEFDKFYDTTKSQIFLFDDAFGKYNTETNRVDSFNRKMEYIFEQIDENHKCIFTSREYIYKDFLNYSDKEIKDYIIKITVEVEGLTKREKESIFLRYYKQYNDGILSQKVINFIINHKNFSPETIRAYFVRSNNFKLEDFKKHLDAPDDYLEKDFINLSEERRIVLISTLLALKGTVNSISYSYDKVCDYLNKRSLVSINDILFQLDGSMLKSNDNEYLFYHPSMFEFFVRYISKDNSNYKKLLFSNINTRLLDVIMFNPNMQLKSNEGKDAIKIGENDLNLLLEGFKRVLDNPELSVGELNAIIGWIENPDAQLGLKLQLRNRYIEFKQKIISLLMNFDNLRILNEDTFQLGKFFKIIRYNYSDIKIDYKFIEKLIETHRDNKDYWYLVVNLMPLLDEEFIFKAIKKDWLNDFFIELRGEINSLGNELYGEAYPEFRELEEYHKLRKSKQKEGQSIEMKNKATYKKDTNRKWYPRYIQVKEKMTSLKSSHPHGYIIYNRLIDNYSHLVALEDNQLNRYLFNKEKGWW